MRAGTGQKDPPVAAGATGEGDSTHDSDNRRGDPTNLDFHRHHPVATNLQRELTAQAKPSTPSVFILYQETSPDRGFASLACLPLRSDTPAAPNHVKEQQPTFHSST